jgi:type I restriction enzyme S subunit
MTKEWQTKKLSEIAKHSLGKMLDKAKNKGEPQPYLRNLNVRWFEFDLSDVLEMPFLPAEAEKYTAVKGDVLICEGGYPGRAAIWEKDQPIYFQKALHRVRFHEPERNRWFLYYLLSRDLDGTLKNHFNGAGIQHFTGEALAKFEVPLPPLAEQQRIVGLLDEAFARLATAKANAEKNLQNARALFESHLQSVFTQRGPGWVEKSLEELGTITSSKRIFKSEYVESGVPFYRTKEIKQLANGRDITTELFISETRYKEIKTGFGVPKEGDILLTAIGTIGEIWVVEGDSDFYFKDGNVLWLKEFASINPHFLRYVLVSFVESLNKMAHGSAYSALPIQRLNEHRIFLPSPAEQEDIVATLDSLNAETQRLAHLYERKLAALEALKKSLLHQAFTGQL